MTIRRILVGLDPRYPREPLLEAAAGLAERTAAELMGLFVENTDLLRFAAMPFAREVGLASGASRPLDVAAMERNLRLLAKEAERQLEAVAGKFSVRWSFRAARGVEASQLLLASARDADLVLVSSAPPVPSPAGMRILTAGDSASLRAALESGEGMLVLVGETPGELAETLHALLEQERDD